MKSLIAALILLGIVAVAFAQSYTTTPGGGGGGGGGGTGLTAYQKALLAQAQAAQFGGLST